MTSRTFDMVNSPNSLSTKPSFLRQIALQGAFLTVGAIASYGFFQWQLQQQELEELAQMVEALQQQKIPDVAARNTPLDLVAIGAPDAAVPATVPAPSVVPIVATEAEPATPALSTAAKI